MASGRNVINQSIRLEGGDEILRQLRSLGEEGERSARKLEQAFGRVSIGNNFAAQFGRLRTSFADLRTAGGRVATSFAGVTRGLSDVGSAFAATSARVTVFAAAVTGAALAAGALIRNSLNRVDDLGDLASSLGVTVTQLQTFQAAATASGIDSATLSRGFISIGEALKELQGTTVKATSGNVRFSSSLDEASSSTVKVISGFSNYGQVVRQGAGETAKLSESARTLSRILKNVGLKPGQEILPVDAFRAVATQFASMEDGAQKTQLSVELFGKRIGPKLIPFLNLGAKGIEKYQQQIEALGLTATNEATSIAGRAADELAFVGFLFEQYANKFATLVAPAVIQATDAILKALATNSDRISAILQQLASSLSSIIVDLVSISFLDGRSAQRDHRSTSRVGRGVPAQAHHRAIGDRARLFRQRRHRGRPYRLPHYRSRHLRQTRETRNVQALHPGTQPASKKGLALEPWQHRAISAATAA